MDFNELHKQLVQDFGLENLSEEDSNEVLVNVATAIQKQFLLDVCEQLGDEKFAALQASAQMGDEFYGTTLKHLVPNYEEVFQEARKKVAARFKEST